MYWLYWHQALGKSFRCLLVYVPFIVTDPLWYWSYSDYIYTAVSTEAVVSHVSLPQSWLGVFSTKTKSGKSQFKKNIHVSVEGSLSFKSTCFNLFSVLIFRCFSSHVEKNRNSNLLLFYSQQKWFKCFLKCNTPVPIKTINEEKWPLTFNAPYLNSFRPFKRLYPVSFLLIQTGGGGVHEPSHRGEDPDGKITPEVGAESVHPGKPVSWGELLHKQMINCSSAAQISVNNNVTP